MMKTQKIKVALFALLLGAGFTSGQLWGSKESAQEIEKLEQEYEKLEQVIEKLEQEYEKRKKLSKDVNGKIMAFEKRMKFAEEREKARKDAEKERDNARKRYEGEIQFLDRNFTKKHDELSYLILKEKEFIDTQKKELTKGNIVNPDYGYKIYKCKPNITNWEKELKALPKELEEEKAYFKTKLDNQLIDIDKRLKEELKTQNYPPLTEKEQQWYEEWKRKNKEIEENIKQKRLEQKKIKEEKKLQEEKQEKELKLSQLKTDMLEFEQQELDKKNKEKEEKEKQQKEQLRRNSFLLQSNSLIYSFISGMLSSLELGINLAHKESFWGTIHNSWKACAIGAAASCLTTGYSYKKLATLEQANPQYKIQNKKSIVTNGLAGHGIGVFAGVVTGMVMGAVAGHSMRKLFGN